MELQFGKKDSVWAGNWLLYNYHCSSLLTARLCLMWCFVDRSNLSLVAMVTVTVAEAVLFVVNKFRHMLEAWWSGFPASLMLLSLHKIKEPKMKNPQPGFEMEKWELSVLRLSFLNMCGNSLVGMSMSMRSEPSKLQGFSVWHPWRNGLERERGPHIPGDCCYQ